MVSNDGYELRFQDNYLAGFLLTELHRYSSARADPQAYDRDARALLRAASLRLVGIDDAA